MAGAAAALVSFGEASTLLDELAGVEVSAKHVERGREAFAREPPAAPTMYLGMDGTAVPVRKEAVSGRAGKQPDGSARTREVKLVTVWTAESTHPKTGRPQRDEGSVSYTGAIESAASRDTDPQPSALAQRGCRRRSCRPGLLELPLPSATGQPGTASTRRREARCWFGAGLIWQTPLAASSARWRPRAERLLPRLRARAARSKASSPLGRSACRQIQANSLKAPSESSPSARRKPSPAAKQPRGCLS